ncbi:MAG: LytR C-terminal domain-containing protein [Endomicrobium sp.]|jgi:hypothetical protein|nr:LytR C-terminal domain-containing protein [Endomicrobium sp.]
MIKNKIIRSFLYLVVLSIISMLLFTYIYVIKYDAVKKKLKSKNYTNCSVLLYGTEKLFPGRVDAYNILYDKKSNILKIVSINTKIIISKKKGNEKTLNDLFNNDKKKNINTAIKNFHLNLQKIFDTTSKFDFYININFETLENITWKNKHLKFIISKNSFENEDLESLNRFEMIEYLIHLMPYTAIKIYKNYSLLNTNISKMSLILSSILRLKLSKPIVLFCILPVKHVNGKVEYNKHNIADFLRTIYYANLIIDDSDSKNIKINVKNASKKPRMAEKIVWFLRANSFDVLDWSNHPITYNKTLIKDHKGNFMQALKIAKALKNGKVIISYDKKFCHDISIFIGKDCVIYDELDKINQKRYKKSIL